MKDLDNNVDNTSNKTIKLDPIKYKITGGNVSFKLRHSFSQQYLVGAALFANKARDIEEAETEESITDELTIEHRAYIVSAFMQAAASLEAEISEILTHGPNHHLGGHHPDSEFLKGIADNLEDNSPLHKCSAVLHILKKPPIKDSIYYRNAKLVIQVRNELVHYKSKWNDQMDEQKLFKNLKDLNFAPPKFSPQNNIFFTSEFLSASSASWAVSSISKFIDRYFDFLGIESPLKNYKKWLKLPAIIKKETH